MIIIIINLFNLFIFVGKTTPQTFSGQTRAFSYLFIYLFILFIVLYPHMPTFYFLQILFKMIFKILVF